MPDQDLFAPPSDDELQAVAQPDIFAPPTPEEIKASQPGMIESGISGLASGLTFGHADELAGAGRAAVAKIGGAPEPISDLYTKYRDEQRAHQDASRSANPLTYYGTGALGTAVTGTAIPMLNPGAAATFRGAAASGALGGALMGEGESNAPLASPSSLVDTGLGAAFGGATGGAVSLIPGLSPSAMQAAAERKAVQAAGGMTKEMRELGTEGVSRVGRELLDKKIVQVGSSLEDISAAAGGAREGAGKEIGAALGKVDDLVKTASEMIDSGKLFPGASDAEKEAAKTYLANQYQFAGKRIANRIESDIINANRNLSTGKTNPVAKNEFAKLQALADDFRDYGTTTLQQGTEIKATQGAKTRFASETVPEAFKQEVYGILKNELEDVVGKTAQLEKALGRPQTADALNQYNAAKNTYGSMSAAEDMAERSLGRQRANRTVSLSDYLAMIGGAHMGGAPAAVALGGVNKAIRAYGDTAAAVGLDKLSSVLSQSPEALSPWASVLSKAASGGGTSLAVTHNILMHNDPNYARTIGGSQ